MNRIYFDNAATTPPDPEVIREMTEVLSQRFGNPSSIHAEGRAARAAIEEARKTVARWIGAGTAEVFFTSCGTESNNMAVKCAVRDLGVRRIISSPTEHHCVLHSIQRVQATDGVEAVWLPVDGKGRIDPDALASALADGSGTPALVSLMHGNNEIGTMLDLERIGEICREYGAYFHSDSVQTMAHFPIDVSKLHVHFLSGSAHKFHGPKGAGFVYVHPDIRIQPFIDGGGQERNMRAGTENIHGIAGLAKAFDLACAGMEEREAQTRKVRDYLKKKLTEQFPDLYFNGDPDGHSLYTVLSVSFPPSPKNEMLLFNLDIAGISCSGGSACTSGAEKGSHVLEAIQADPDRKSVRFSFSHHNTLEEVDFLLEKLKTVLPEKVASV